MRPFYWFSLLFFVGNVEAEMKGKVTKITENRKRLLLGDEMRNRERQQYEIVRGPQWIPPSLRPRSRQKLFEFNSWQQQKFEAMSRRAQRERQQENFFQRQRFLEIRRQIARQHRRRELMADDEWEIERMFKENLRHQHLAEQRQGYFQGEIRRRPQNFKNIKTTKTRIMYSPVYEDFDDGSKPKFFFIKDLKPVEKSYRKSKLESYAFSPGKSFFENFDLPKPNPRLGKLAQLRNTTMSTMAPIDKTMSNSLYVWPITKGWPTGFSEPTMRRSTVARAKNTLATTTSNPPVTVARIGSPSATVFRKRLVTNLTAPRNGSTTSTVSKVTLEGPATVPRIGATAPAATVSKTIPATTTVPQTLNDAAVTKATVLRTTSTTPYPTVLSTRPGWGRMVFPTSFIRRKPEMTTASPTIQTTLLSKISRVTTEYAIPKTPVILTTTNATATVTANTTTTSRTTVTSRFGAISSITVPTTAPRWSRFTLPNQFIRRKTKANAVSRNSFNNNQSAFIRIKPNASTTVISDSRFKNQPLTERSNATLPLNRSMFSGKSTIVAPTLLQDPRFNAANEQLIEIKSQIFPGDFNPQKYDEISKIESNAYAKRPFFSGKSRKRSKNDRNFRLIVPGVRGNVYSNGKSLKNSKMASNFRLITPGKQISIPNTVLRPNTSKDSQLKIRIYTVIDKIH